jgi:hypothetical protein
MCIFQTNTPPILIAMHQNAFRLLTLTVLSLLVVLPTANAASDQYREEAVQVEHQAPAATDPAARTAPAAASDQSVFHRPREAAPGAAQQRRSNTLGIISISFGAAALVFAFIIGILALLFSLTAIVTGALGIGRDDSPGLSIGGLILGILVLLLYLIVILILAAVLI